MSEQIDLKPCPFCGGSAYITDDDSMGLLFYVHCCCCGANPYFDNTPEGVAAMWNRRADDD